MPALPVGERDAIAYDDIGHGPLVVLIHGSPGSSRSWQPVAPSGEGYAGAFDLALEVG